MATKIALRSLWDVLGTYQNENTHMRVRLQKPSIEARFVFEPNIVMPFLCFEQYPVPLYDTVTALIKRLEFNDGQVASHPTITKFR